MTKLIAGVIAFLSLFAMSPGAWAFGCPNRIAAAETAIADATAAMNKMSDASAKGLVHTLIDDAKMALHSSKHNHANAAEGYAKAASVLASK